MKFGFKNRVANILLRIVLVLTFFHIMGLFGYYCFGIGRKEILVKLTDLNHETNIPTYYQMCALFLSSSILGIIAFFKQKLKDKMWLNWAFLSIVFSYLALDEATTIHENWTTFMRNVLNVHTSGFFKFSWVIVGMVLVLLFVLINLKFLISLKPKHRNQLIISGIVYVIGAIGFEMLSGEYGNRGVFVHFLVTIEEFLEMLGIVLFVNVLISYLKEEMAISKELIVNEFFGKYIRFLREEEPVLQEG